MKKLINKPEDVVKESLEGFALAHPELEFVTTPRYIRRKSRAQYDKVAIVSGGGSGHEPLHNSYVGYGMLDGACPGEIFSAPTPDQIYECAKAVHSGNGVLLIVKNYTGDVLSFETAIELLHEEGISVANVLIDDDVSQNESLLSMGRRGTGTTLVVEKIVGAAAEMGYSLDQCLQVAQAVITNGWSIGMALTSCTVPSKGSPTFDLAEDQIEIGIGIHGEHGLKQIPFQAADDIVELMADRLFRKQPYRRHLREWNREVGAWLDVEFVNPALKAGDQVIAIVNGMGGTPLSELYIVYRKLFQLCEAQGISIVRNLVGSYITSLDMQGCSITLVRVSESMLRFWDAPVNTSGLRWGV
ncbi:MAG: dihydroxyacetone kinase subunit DhaK [Chloroflexota bacterium]